MRVGVIGAGPAGLTAAYCLVKAGVDVEVFEASPHVGGLARTIELWGQKVDVGPHRFFSQDARVNRLWLEVVEKDYRMVDRLTRIYYRGRFFHYPLRAGNALRNMGLLNAALCVLSYLKARVFPSRVRGEPTFESWVTGRFGRRLFEIFFKSYSEKLWGLPCAEIDADFAAQRIKRFSLGEAINGALGIGRRTHKTLVDRFAYPLGGTGSVYARMAEQVGRVRLSCPVRRVVHEEKVVRGIELDNGRFEPFDHVISTMPLTLLTRGLGEPPSEVDEALGRLKFRNTLLVYLHVDAVDLFPDQWLYIHSPDLRVGRLTNFRNWIPELCGDSKRSILALEFWCNDGEEAWAASDESLIEQATLELRSTGLIGGQVVLEGRVVRLRRCYPVYARGYREALQTVIRYLKTFSGLTPIGRYGAFKYNNQDHSILMGLLAAENLAGGKRHDLWSVNTDYDTYQEGAVITETGLVEQS